MYSPKPSTDDSGALESYKKQAMAGELLYNKLKRYVPVKGYLKGYGELIDEALSQYEKDTSNPS